MELPNITSYGEYKGSNTGLNTLCVWVGDLAIYFSYRTPVAFYTLKTGLVISENVWSRTTGKHLNWICRDTPRTEHGEFKVKFANVLWQQGRK